MAAHQGLPAAKPGSALAQKLAQDGAELQPVRRSGRLPGSKQSSVLGGYLGIIAAGLSVAVPLYFVVITSLKLRPEIYSNPISWLPRTWAPENYSYVWQNLDFSTYLLNSIII
ncbi:MAG: hypothetical protein Q3965_05875, partial [Rothia sp. (in: high G+C Gram-positive bacteria)]|nr:hypothetical protein [Rothia sp. (in: high G+C Gram-positive bacteria)]